MSPALAEFIKCLVLSVANLTAMNCKPNCSLIFRWQPNSSQRWQNMKQMNQKTPLSAWGIGGHDAINSWTALVFMRAMSKGCQHRRTDNWLNRNLNCLWAASENRNFHTQSSATQPRAARWRWRERIDIVERCEGM